jgi:peptidoglycan hydrolase-like protein with peptidoglycan-binding domain
MAPATAPVVEQMTHSPPSTIPVFDVNTSSEILLSQLFNRVLQLGDVGDDVADLQARLAEIGYYTGPIDGDFGPLTEDAVLRFQQDYGLQVDGVAGNQTFAALGGSFSGGGIGAIGDDFDNYNWYDDGSDSYFGSVLSLDDIGREVENIQRRLFELGFYDGPITGRFGRRTEDGVRKFQRSQGIREDGIVGPETLDALRNPVGLRGELEGDRFANSSLDSGSILAGQSDQYSVADLQQRLQAEGFYFGPIDNILGIETQEAIQDAQGAFGLSAGDILE